MCVCVCFVDLLMCFGIQVACCCGSAACSLLCHACGSCNNSSVTRIVYALVLLLGTIVACVMLAPGLADELGKVWVPSSYTVTLAALTVLITPLSHASCLHPAWQMNSARFGYHLLTRSLCGINSANNIFCWRGMPSLFSFLP